MKEKHLVVEVVMIRLNYCVYFIIVIIILFVIIIMYYDDNKNSEWYVM